MERGALPDKDVRRELRRWVAIYVDTTSPDFRDPEVNQYMQSKYIPAVVAVSPDGEVKEVANTMSAGQLLGFLKRNR